MVAVDVVGGAEALQLPEQRLHGGQLPLLAGDVPGVGDKVRLLAAYELGQTPVVPAEAHAVQVADMDYTEALKALRQIRKAQAVVGELEAVAAVRRQQQSDQQQQGQAGEDGLQQGMFLHR